MEAIVGMMAERMTHCLDQQSTFVLVVLHVSVEIGELFLNFNFAVS